MGERATILLVVDEGDQRGLHRLSLEIAGHRVVTADGGGALQQAREERPDLVLFDLARPTADGWDLLGAFQADDVVGDVPLVVLTTSADECDELRARDLGVAAYVTNPICADDLLHTIERLLAAAPGPHRPPETLDHHEAGRRHEPEQPEGPDPAASDAG